MSSEVESVCTGVSATWCPRHGDCKCEERADGMGRTFTDAGCPLHGHGSMHPDTPAPWRFDVPVVPARVTCVEAVGWGPGMLFYRLGQRDAWTMRIDKGADDEGLSTRHLIQYAPLIETVDPRAAS